MTDAAYDAFRNRLESGGDDNAYNPRSGALGKHQFLASTWLGLVRRHQPSWAQGLSTAQILDQRRDGARSDQMIALYDQHSAQQLAGAGYAATPGNLYLAHHFGAAGARNILGATDDTPMRALVTRAAYRANPHLHGKTKAQVLADFVQRGGGSAPSAPAPHAQPPTRPLRRQPKRSLPLRCRRPSGAPLRCRRHRLSLCRPGRQRRPTPCRVRHRRRVRRHPKR